MTSDLDRAVTHLVNRVSHWTPPRWAASSASGRSRAAIVHELVQRLADLSADLEGQPRRPVPRIEPVGAVADQLRVVAADVGRAVSAGAGPVRVAGAGRPGAAGGGSTGAAGDGSAGAAAVTGADGGSGPGPLPVTEAVLATAATWVEAVSRRL